MFLVFCEIHALLALFFEHSDSVCKMHDTVCALMQYIAIYYQSFSAIINFIGFEKKRPI